MGCADDEGIASRDRPAELVAPAESDIALAILRDEDATYVARARRLQRIERQTGTLVDIAGEEWSTCPRDPSIRWADPADHYHSSRLLVRGTTIVLVEPFCGLWSFDLVTRQRRMLVDPSFAAKEAVFAATGSYPEGALWNGTPGPIWAEGSGMAIAVDGDGLVGCFVSAADESDPTVPGVRPRPRERVELWSIGLDGAPRERLGFVSRDASIDGEGGCGHVLADETGISFDTAKAVRRWDRQTRALTTTVGGLAFLAPGLLGDGTHVYLVQDNAVVKVPKSGGERVTLVPSSKDPREGVRRIATVDDDGVYFLDDFTLRRTSKDGTKLVDIALGSEGDRMVPDVVGVVESYVYFERITKAAGTGVYDPEKRAVTDPLWLGAIFRTRK